MGILDRLLLIIGGLMMIYPGTLTDLIGFALIAAGIALQVVARNSRKGKASK